MSSQLEPVPSTSKRFRFARIASLRIVSALFGLIGVLCTAMPLAFLLTKLWPQNPIPVQGELSLLDFALVAGLGYGSLRTALGLWQRDKRAGIVALGLFGYTIVINYYGPLKGTQSVGLVAAMILLLAFGWRELE